VAVSSGDAQLDRRIVNTLREAFLHLVRNAVDHGVETPEERRLTGKPQTATIRIEAASEADRVQLHISDDGRGIDERSVVAAAIAGGLLESNQVDDLDHATILNLLLQPSFSTRKETSPVSGRGIGLDAVAAAVRSVGGDVWLESHAGTGTTVTVELPVARRGDRVLVLQSAGRLAAIPAAPVQAFRRLPVDALEEREGRLVARVGDRILEPHFIGGTDTAPSGGAWILLEMLVGGVAVAVAADRVVGEEEVIVRPIPAGAGAARRIEGMTVLSSGRPVPVLSLRHLAPGADGDGLHHPVANLDQERGVRVLMVDDSEVTRELFRNLLEESGFEVVTASTGEEAVRILDSRAVDCVVTDIEMPGMSGLDLTRKLRNDSRFAALPVIVVSTRDRPADRLSGLDAGADAYLTKQGLDARELVALVARVAGSR
jgi:CheY-like chemotaxis protein